MKLECRTGWSGLSLVLTQRLFPNFSELQGRVDGVFMRPCRLDAVDVAVRESTRRVHVQRQFRDAIVPRRRRHDAEDLRFLSLAGARVLYI